MNTNLQFRIQAAELHELQLIQPKTEIDIAAIEFEIELEHKMDLKENLLIVLSSVTLVSGKNQLGHIVVSCHYLVDNLTLFLLRKSIKKDWNF